MLHKQFEAHKRQASADQSKQPPSRRSQMGEAALGTLVEGDEEENEGEDDNDDEDDIPSEEVVAEHLSPKGNQRFFWSTCAR